MKPIRLDEAVSVAGQVSPAEMDEIGAAGFRTIVNNRPDGEEPGQPDSKDIEAAALAAGLNYAFIPVAGGVSEAQIGAMETALAGARGPLLAFCRSGTRSTWLWALARSRMGDDSGELIVKAEAAGFDLAPIKAFLDKG